MCGLWMLETVLKNLSESLQGQNYFEIILRYCLPFHNVKICPENTKTMVYKTADAN